MKILIVDDSKSCRLRLVKILEESPQMFDIFQAENGSDALSICEENENIDLILSDINMPEMDGLTFLKLVRNKLKKDSVPFLIYSTECSEELKKTARSFKASAWIIKPAKPHIILMALDKFRKILLSQKVAAV